MNSNTCCFLPSSTSLPVCFLISFPPRLLELRQPDLPSGGDPAIDEATAPQRVQGMLIALMIDWFKYQWLELLIRGTMQHSPTCSCAGRNRYNTPLIILSRADYRGPSFRLACVSVPTHAAMRTGFWDTCLTGPSRPRCCRRPLQPSPGCWATCCACGSFSAGCGAPGRWWGGFLH